MPEVYISLLIEDMGTTILATSFSKDTALNLSMSYVTDTGGPTAWMNIHDKGDKPQAEEVFTRRDLSAEIWILKRPMDV